MVGLLQAGIQTHSDKQNMTESVARTEGKKKKNECAFAALATFEERREKKEKQESKSAA